MPPASTIPLSWAGPLSRRPSRSFSGQTLLSEKTRCLVCFSGPDLLCCRYHDFFGADLGTGFTGQVASADQSPVQEGKKRPHMETPHKQTGTLGAVSGFLRAYRLSQYRAPFLKALADNRFSEISDIILLQTGLQLVALDNVSDHIRNHYGILAYPSATTGDMMYYLFWRPRLRLGNFFYGYQGDGIRDLQKRLRDLHLYTAPVDGIVGRNLIRAVIHFQEQARLPATGLPDDLTLFLLCQQGGTKHHAG